jgi:hypothetical protein
MKSFKENSSFRHIVLRSAIALVITTRVFADAFFFNTGDPDGRIATASRPPSVGKSEIESADDFALAQGVSLTGATFTGLVPTDASLASINNVTIEIYRVFPKDSDVGRTTGAPTFSTDQVPTRVNSPSDVAFESREALGGSLTFSAATLAPSFTANNSVLNGINPKPNQNTGGDGPVTGQEVQLNVQFTTPINLPADHYFFVPQVELASGDFYWLSSPKPIVPPGTPFVPDLQSWIRNENLAPDWLRLGTDIVGGQPAPTFNASFSLTGVLQENETVPDTGSTAELAEIALLSFALIAWPGRNQNKL